MVAIINSIIHRFLIL